MGIRVFIVFCEFLSTPSARRATDVGGGHLSRVQFLSTPSARRATGDIGAVQRQAIISIHALREEGDSRFPATSAPC